jgi:ABC-2 type transport system permease protein
MSAFAYHIGYEFKGGLRDKSHLFMNYLFPLLFLVLVGAFMTRLDPSFSGRIVPAMTIFAVMCAFLLSMPTSLVAARDSGMLRSYRINGVPAWAAIASPAIANIGHMAIISVIIALVSALAFGAPPPANWALWASTWVAMSAAIAGLGALIGVISSSNRAATLFAQCVYLPSIILGGLMTPPGILPPMLDRFSLLFPARHAMRAFAGGPGAAVSIAALVIGSAVAFALAAFLFEWDGNNARPGARKLLALLAFAPYAAAILVA